MGAISRLLARWGFVRLDEFGLVLTADRRIAATRSSVLDDGAGSRIVGWRDDDLAVAALPPWTPPPIPARARPAPSTPPLVPARATTEDEWEWQIATARARAIVDEIERTPAEPDDWETPIAVARVRAERVADFVEPAGSHTVIPVPRLPAAADPAAVARAFSAERRLRLPSRR